MRDGDLDGTDGANADLTPRRSRAIRALVQESTRGYRAVIGERAPRRLLGAALLSEIADWFNIVAVIALAARFGDDTLAVGVTLALRLVPRLVLQGPAGALVDRARGRGLLVASQLVMAVVAGAFALLSPYPELWLLWTLTVLLETANVIALPAFRAFLAAVTPREQRGAANGLLQVGMTVAHLVGPLIGLAVLASSGAVPVFLANALTFVITAVVVLRLPIAAAPASEVHKSADESDRTTGQVIGYRWLIGQRDLAAYMALHAAIGVIVQAAVALFVIRAITIGWAETGFGGFYTAVAIGSIIGGLVAGMGIHQHGSALYRVAGALAGCAIALAVFGATETALLALAALLVAGLATDIGEVTALTYFQQRLPDEVYGRFFSLFLIALGGGGIVGALLGPVLARAVGSSLALAVLGAPVVVLAIGLSGVTRGQLRTALDGDVSPPAQPVVVDSAR